jgi:phage tail sheath gpL-like
MPISFSSFPANWKMPLWWAELDSSMAGTPTSRNLALLVGQMIPMATGGTTPAQGGIATPNVPIVIGSLAEAGYQFGIGSMLERMFAAFLETNVAQEMWALPVPDPPGTAATGTITVGGSTTPTFTPGGTIALYIAGQRMQIGVEPTDANNDIATNIGAAINANPELPVSATVAAAIVTLTCKWKGATGNEVDLRDSYYGTRGGEQLPPGLTLTYSHPPVGVTGAKNGTLGGGTGAPDFTTGIATLGDEPYEYVAMPYTDAASIQAWSTEYGFSETGRWGWARQDYGMIFSAKRGLSSDLIMWGMDNNEATISFMGFELTSPSPSYEWAAGYCANGSMAFDDDPARPLQTLMLNGLLAAPKHQRFMMTELNTLAQNGIATERASTDTVTPMIMRESTAYQYNLYGAADNAYELLTTLATLAALLRNQRQAITDKFPRHKLANDGTRFGPGQAIVTPSTIKAELVSEYALDEWNGLVEDSQDFKNNLIVERDTNNPNRVNVLYPPDLINQLRVFAVLAQFRLQYNQANGGAITNSGGSIGAIA